MATHYLRRELAVAIVLKLLLLYAIKFAFFPPRLKPEEAAQGMAERMASQSAPVNVPPLKDKP